MLQVDALRLRLEEKESFLNKKTKQLQDLTEEKGTLAGEIRDIKDMLEVKERKINVLQKKVRFGAGRKGSLLKGRAATICPLIDESIKRRLIKLVIFHAMCIIGWTKEAI